MKNIGMVSEKLSKHLNYSICQLHKVMTYFVLFNLIFVLETATEKEQNDGYVYHVY